MSDEETVVEWAVVDNGLPGDPFPGDEDAGMYIADSEEDARATWARWHARGADVWIERRTVTYGEWERVPTEPSDPSMKFEVTA